MVGALFSSDAWNNVTFTAGEVRNPRRNLPLSLALGVLVVSALYIASNLTYLSVLTFPEIQNAAEDRVATAAAAHMFGSVSVQLMAAAIMISTFGCANGLILSGARVYYAMAKDRLFFARAGRLTQPALDRPYKAFGYPVLPAAYIAAAGLIEILLLLYKPDYTWPGLIIVLLGLPVYFIWRKREVKA